MPRLEAVTRLLGQIPGVDVVRRVTHREITPATAYKDAFRSAIAQSLSGRGIRAATSTRVVTISAEPCAQDGGIELPPPLGDVIADIYGDCLPEGQAVGIKEVTLWEDAVVVKVDSPDFQRNETNRRFLALSDGTNAIFDEIAFNMSCGERVIATGNAEGPSMWIYGDGRQPVTPLYGSRETLKLDVLNSLVALVPTISARDHITISVHGHKTSA